MSDTLRTLRAALARVGGMFLRDRRERDLSDELADHLALHTEENLKLGMSPDEARRQALLRLGGLESVKEQYRDRRSVPFVETTLQDLRYGVRTLRNNPAFTSVAVMTLALGIAINATIFSMVSAILVRKPPVSDSNRVVILTGINTLDPRGHFGVAIPDFIEWREQSHSFVQMGASINREFNITGGAEPQRAGGLLVTPGYFSMLGVPAAMGRSFTSDEFQPGRDHVVILSHGLWTSRYNSDPSIVGKDVTLDGARYTIIGVMPRRFRLNMFDAALWTPLVFTNEQVAASGRAEMPLSVIARLRPGTSPTEANAELTTIAKREEQSYPATNRNRGVAVIGLQEFMIQEANVRPALLVLMSTVAFVLLIACSNIANLLLARNAARRRELVIRAAVGAGRLRLIRQLLVESLVLGLVGGGFGLLVAYWCMQLLRAQLNWNDYVQLMASEMVLDANVLGFCMLVSVFAAVLFGLLPALQASKFDLNAALNESTRGGSGGVRLRRLRASLVAGQIALSIVLLVGAGVLIQNLLLELRQNVGFQSGRAISANVRVSGSRYSTPQQQAGFFRDVVAEARRLSGVESASVASTMPAKGTAGWAGFRLEDHAAGSGVEFKARSYVVGAQYFVSMGIPVLQGREFLDSDSADSAGVVVINETFARRFFAHQDPVGRSVRVDHGLASGWARIVGVSAPVRDFIGEPEFEPQIYECYLQQPQSSMTVILKTKSDPAGFAPELRRAVWAIDKDQPITAVQTMARSMDDNFAGDRLITWLMGGFGAMALLLAAVGLFGVVSYNVAQRTRELGIRVALGASKREVMRLVFRQSALVTVFGLGLGLLTAFPIPRILGGIFNGLVVNTAPLLVLVTVSVATVTLLSSFVPARRATRVEPMIALHYE